MGQAADSEAMVVIALLRGLFGRLTYDCDRYASAALEMLLDSYRVRRLVSMSWVHCLYLLFFSVGSPVFRVWVHCLVAKV